MNYTAILNIGLIAALMAFGYRHSHASQTLSLMGSVHPKEITAIGIPINGTVSKLYVGHGQMVEKGSVILTVKSVKLKMQTTQAILDYFMQKKIHNIRAEEMQNHKLYTQLDIKPRRQYELHALTYQQSKIQLEKAHRHLMIFISPTNELYQPIIETNPDDDQSVKQILTHPSIGEHIITAPHAGMIIVPTVGENCKNTLTLCYLAAGYHILAEEHFLYIAHSGGRIIKAFAQLEIFDKIHLHQAVKISHPHLTKPLEGKITRISSVFFGNNAPPNNADHARIYVEITPNPLHSTERLPLESLVKIIIKNQ